MPPAHLTGTSRALYRVFVLPNLRTTALIPLFCAPAFACSSSSASRATSLLPLTTTRQKHFKKDTQRHALSDHYVLDKAIDASHVNFVDENGVFNPNLPLEDAVRSINRVTQHLLQVDPGKVDEYGNQDPDHPPTCRVVTKIALREKHQQTLERLRKQGKGPAMKNLELNWAIAEGDLKHRLERLRDFLKQGLKVEILFGPKKRGKKATEQEAEAVLKSVREVVGECKGATEVKTEGAVKGVFTIVFQGKESKESKEKDTGGKEKGKEEVRDGKQANENVTAEAVAS